MCKAKVSGFRLQVFRIKDQVLQAWVSVVQSLWLWRAPTAAAMALKKFPAGSRLDMSTLPPECPKMDGMLCWVSPREGMTPPVRSSYSAMICLVGPPAQPLTWLGVEECPWRSR